MLRVNLSVAVVAMTTNKTHRLPNGTTTEYPDFEWDSATQGLVLARFLEAIWQPSTVGNEFFFGE